jgi:hypothetical protein
LCNLLLPSFRAIEFHNKEERKERTEPIELVKSSSSSSSAVVTAAGRGESISSFSLPLVDARSANRRLVHIFTEPTHASSSRHHQTQTPTNKKKKIPSHIHNLLLPTISTTTTTTTIFFFFTIITPSWLSNCDACY